MFTCLRVAAIAALLAVGLYGQAGSKNQAIFAPSLLNGVTAPAVSAPVRNIGQCMHVFVVIFPAAVADVNPIQVRIEASYDNSVYFPISPDVIEAKLLGGVVYFIQKAYGVFPYVRVRSVLATPASAPMTVHYSGHVLPVVPVLFETLDRFVL
ncbi:MAG: hypothetical protein IPK75_20530 [Acidobacteria bacterium]|nr:hypothetical protein [Acidobacteriota bacterium]